MPLHKMYKHSFSRCLDFAGNLIGHEASKTRTCGKLSLLDSTRFAAGYIVPKHNYSTSNKPEEKLTTIDLIRQKAQEELEEHLKNPQNAEEYKKFKFEIDYLRYTGRAVPTDIGSFDLLCLLRTQSVRARRHFLEVLYKRELISKRKEAQKLEKVLTRDHQKLPWYDGEQLYYGLHKNNFFLRIYDSTVNRFRHHKLLGPMMFEQPIIFDLTYDEHMRFSELSFCAKQIALAFGINRMHPEPCNMLLSGGDGSSEVLKHLFRYIPTLYDNAFPLNIDPKPYWETVDLSKVVYLTPHCSTRLRKFDHEAIYIIGGIVDKGSQIPHSHANAKKHGVKMAKFPLEEYVNWGTAASKTLTLNQVLAILLDFRMTDDWNIAFKHIPTRKQRREEQQRPWRNTMHYSNAKKKTE